MTRVHLHRLGIIISLLFIGHGSIAQDRNVLNNVIYPDGAFVPNGGRVIDVTQPPYNATGDGVTDDTEAIIAAYTFVTDRLQEFTWRDNQNRASYILYFPAGTYLVSNTIIHEGELSFVFDDIGDMFTEGAALIRMVGQNRETTTIRLKDNCPGFEAGAEKPVLSFQKVGVGRREGTNIPASNQLSDIIINTGNGNPGAIGALFLGANVSEIRNVTIKSEDGAGFVGLDLPFASIVGYYHDISVAGFDFGIRILPSVDTAPTLEYITLNNQNQAGMLLEDGSPSIRKLRSTNAGPAIRMTGSRAHAVIIDSDLRGGDANTAAIDWQDTLSQLFVRNVQTGSYGSAIRRAGTDVATGTVDEFVSDQVYTLFEDIEKRSLNLPINESPILDWEQDTSQWANVDEFPGATDSERIQNAMNSGKSVVYFPRSFYENTEPVTIPASVRHVDFMYTRPSFNSQFIVSEASGEPLFIDHSVGRGVVVQNAPRTVVVRNASINDYTYNSDQPSELYLESCVNSGSNEAFCPPPLKIWARSVNDENKQTSNFKVYGGTMWTLGFKTEGQQTSFDAQQGGTIEVLGGTQIGTLDEENQPYVRNENSTVSFIGHTFLGSAYEFVVIETQSGITRELVRSDVPVRPPDEIVRFSDDIYVPLYVGRAGAAEPVNLVPAPLPATTMPTQAQLSWSNRNEGTGNYEVRYRRFNTTEWTTVSDIGDTTVTVDGLLSGISYEWEVRTLSSETSGVSEWSALARFVTDLEVSLNPTPLAIDGTLDEEVWQTVVPITKELIDNTVGAEATFNVLWDSTYLYVAARVIDSILFNDSDAAFEDDGVEVYLDANNNGGAYDANDNQIILSYQADSLFVSRPFDGDIQYGLTTTEQGYTVELAIPWAGLGLTPASGVSLGFDIGVNDDSDGGQRDGQRVWAGNAFNFRDTSPFGDLVLQGAPGDLVPVFVSARGTTGEEQFELQADGRKIGATQNTTTSTAQYFFLLREPARSYRIVFTNDGIADNGQDKNLFIDKITVDDEVLETEDQLINTASYNQELGECGGVPAELLQCDGYVEYVPGGVPVVVEARGTTGEEQFELLVDGQRVGNPQDVTTALTEYTFVANGAANSYRVAFINDGRTNDDRDKNLFVDKVTVGDEVFEVEAQPINTASFNQESGQCGGVPADLLQCDGYVELTNVAGTSDSSNSENALISAKLGTSSPFAVYPNPTEEGRLAVVLKSTDVVLDQVTVRDAQGRRRLTQSVKGVRQFTLEVSHLTPGVYTLEVTSRQQTYTEKIIIR